jgi:hypothetical protein
VATNNFFAPLRNDSKSRPPPIILTSEDDLVSREIKIVMSGEFFWNNATGIQVTTKSMVNYNAIQKFLTEKNLHFFIFYTKTVKLVKAVIRHLPGNTSAEDITVAF